MFTRIFNWIFDNKEWFLSGIGVTIILAITGFIRSKLKKLKKTNTDSSDITITQENKGQNNTQIGIQNNYYGGNNER